MATRQRPTVIDATGARGELRGFVERDGRTVATVELAGGRRAAIPADLLHLEDDGGYTIPGRWSEVVTESPRGLEVPVLQEDVAVTVREVPRERVRVRRRVVTDHREVSTPVWVERVEVERVPRGVIVDRAPPSRHDGDTLVIPIVEEVPVVETRLVLREELRVRVIREREIVHQRVAVRRHEVEIEREPVAASEPINPEEDEGEPT